MYDPSCGPNLLNFEPATNLLYIDAYISFPEAGRRTRLELSSTKYVKLSTDESPCKDWSAEELEVCIENCLKYRHRFFNWQVCTNKNYYIWERLQGKYENGSNCTESLKNCEVFCPKFCTIHNYRISTVASPVLDRLPNTSKQFTSVEILFADEGRVHVYEEIKSFTTVNLIGNFGGLFSFFFGASLISLPQLILFIFDMCKDKILKLAKVRIEVAVNEDIVSMEEGQFNSGFKGIDLHKFWKTNKLNVVECLARAAQMDGIRMYVLVIRSWRKLMLNSFFLAVFISQEVIGLGLRILLL